jgi:hypothetical protein
MGGCVTHLNTHQDHPSIVNLINTIKKSNNEDIIKELLITPNHWWDLISTECFYTENKLVDSFLKSYKPKLQYVSNIQERIAHIESKEYMDEYEKHHPTDCLFNSNNLAQYTHKLFVSNANAAKDKNIKDNVVKENTKSIKVIIDTPLVNENFVKDEIKTLVRIKHVGEDI